MVRNSPIPSYATMGLPGSLLYGKTQTLPSSLNDQSALSTVKAPDLELGRKIKVQSSLP